MLKGWNPLLWISVLCMVGIYANKFARDEDMQLLRREREIEGLTAGPPVAARSSD